MKYRAFIISLSIWQRSGVCTFFLTCRFRVLARIKSLFFLLYSLRCSTFSSRHFFWRSISLCLFFTLNSLFFFLVHTLHWLLLPEGVLLSLLNSSSFLVLPHVVQFFFIVFPLVEVRGGGPLNGPPLFGSYSEKFDSNNCLIRNSSK